MRKEADKQIQESLCRPTRYANIDGVTEMTMGMMFFEFRLMAWIPSVTANGSVWHNIFVLVGIVCFWQAAVGYGFHVFKKRVTYRRTGYVAYRKPDLKRPAAVAFLVAMVVSALLVYFVTRKHIQLPVILIGGACLMAAYASFAWPMQPWKWGVIAVMAAGALAVPYFSNKLDTQMMVALTFYAGMYTLAGLITLVLYLKNSRPFEMRAE